jgi:spore coat polysaccharide biosynthesis predicted glycosyltransferase SpsG
MSLYTTTKPKTFTGEVEPIIDLVLTDELTIEDLPFKVIKRELNKELLFIGHALLSEYNNLLIEEAI